jgi:uncharacterized protein DUF4190
MSRTQPATSPGTGYAPPAGQRTSKRAVWSLVLSIISLGGVGSIAAIVLGASARRRIALTGERGAGLAMAGIVIGVVTLLLWVVYWVIVAMHGGGSGGGGGGGGY